MNKILSLFAATAALAGVSTQAHAHEKYQSQTRGNQASFSTFSETECGYEAFYVYAFEEERRGQGDQTAYESVYIDYYSYDYCTGASVYGGGMLDGASMELQRLNSASIDGSTLMDIYSCNYDGGGGGGEGGMGGTAGAGGAGGADGGSEDGGVYEDPCTYASVGVEVSVDLTGIGDSYRDRSTYTSSTPYSRYRSRYTGTSREATVSGVLTVDGHAIDLSSAYGNLAQTTSGSFEMWR